VIVVGMLSGTSMDGARVLGRISRGHAPLRLPDPVGAVHSLEVVPRGDDPVALRAPGLPSRAGRRGAP
jgi:hypothetical protein